MSQLIVGFGGPQEVAAGTGGALIANAGPATVSYADSPDVQFAAAGTIAPAASETLYGSVWLYASSRADLNVTLLGGGSALPGGGTPGQVVVNTAPGEGEWGDAGGGNRIVFGAFDRFGDVNRAGSGDWDSVESDAGVFTVTVTGSMGSAAALSVACSPHAQVSTALVSGTVTSGTAIDFAVRNTSDVLASVAGVAFVVVVP